MNKWFGNMFGRRPVSAKTPKAGAPSSPGGKVSFRTFRKNRLALYALRFIYFLIGVALLADLLANEKPIVASREGRTYWPIFRSYAVNLGWAQWPEAIRNVDWHKTPFEWALRPPIPYSPTNMDPNNTHSVSPFATQDVKNLYWRHWLGTDELGHDILAAMIHGTRISLLVGLVSMGIAGLIGVFLGACAGYYGDHRLKTTVAGVILNLLGIFLAYFYAFEVRQYTLASAAEASIPRFLWELVVSFLIALGIMTTGNLIAKLFRKIPLLGKKVPVPVDILVMRTIEVLLSIPTLFLILALVATVEQPSLLLIMAVIGFTQWTEIARLMRGELLRVRSLEYIEAARSLGGEAYHFAPRLAQRFLSSPNCDRFRHRRFDPDRGVPLLPRPEPGGHDHLGRPSRPGPG